MCEGKTSPGDNAAQSYQEEKRIQEAWRIGFQKDVFNKNISKKDIKRMRKSHLKS